MTDPFNWKPLAQLPDKSLMEQDLLPLCIDHSKCHLDPLLNRSNKFYLHDFRYNRSWADSVNFPANRIETVPGRSVTPCSALSQASCQSPDDQMGAGLLPEEVGVLVSITICEKSPAEATVTMAADAKRWRRSATRF